MSNSREVNSRAHSPESAAEDTWWQAPAAAGPINWTVSVPGSKSMTNRALVLAALASYPSTITNALVSRDTELMISALQALGTSIDRGEGSLGAAGSNLRVTPGPLRGGSVDCGLAGTVMRFVPPVAALAEGTVFFDGDPAARKRPMGTMLEALRELGVRVDSAEGNALPFTVTGTGQLAGGVLDIDASSSSQFVSGLLLAAARFTRGLTVRHRGGTLPSLPHIDMTVEMLRLAGVDVDNSRENEWRVSPGEIHGRTWTIEPDLSNATPFLAAAAVTGGRVRIRNWPVRTSQAGDAIRWILASMGCEVELISSGAGYDLEVHGPHPGELKGISIDLSDLGELTPTVAALAVAANSPSTLTGIAHLRGHETDRLAALTTEINRVGGACTEMVGGLEITPRPLLGGLWHTYADHRMATAGAIIGLTNPIQVQNIDTTSKTLPGFADLWDEMAHHIGTNADEKVDDQPGGKAEDLRG